MKATRYAERLNKRLSWLIGLALLLALVLPYNGTGVVQASPGTVTLRPNADVMGEINLSIGGTSPAPSNWESVDEVSSDDDVTYVEDGGGIYATDLYNLDDTSLSGAIRSVTIYVNCKGTKLGAESARTTIKTNGVVDDGTPEILTTDYVDYSTVYTTNPQSGNPWTWDEINALQAGVGLKKPTGGAQSRCTQVWVDVEYFSTAISIVGKVADTAVGTITFPEGAPDATVSDPYNDVDGDTDKQVLHASTSEPVVRLKNTSAGTLTVWLEITTWGNGVAVSEDYELVDTTDVETVTGVLSADGNAAIVNTTVTMATTTYKALYLELVLSSLAGKSGSSTLTILGESA